MKHKLAIWPSVAAKFHLFSFGHFILFFYLPWAATEGATSLHVPIAAPLPLSFPKGKFELLPGCFYLNISVIAFWIVQKTSIPSKREKVAGQGRGLLTPQHPAHVPGSGLP